jgi:alkaline phosphatase D
MNMSEFDFYDKPDRPWPNPRLTNAAIVGDTTTTSSKLWFRVHKEGDYCVILSLKPITQLSDAKPIVKEDGDLTLETIESGKKISTLLSACQKINLTFSTDLTGTVIFEGIQPGTTYFYACFSIAEQKSPWEFSGKSYHFRTQKESPDSLVFGFYSCHMPYPSGGGVRNISQWKRMETVLTEFDADFAIGCGDQIYTDGNKHVSIWSFLKKMKSKMLELTKDERIDIMVSWYRDIYRGYWGHKEVRAFFARFPQYMIWDDHEIMDGWGSYTDKELSGQLNTWWEWDNPDANLELALNMREAAEIVYNEYQHSHNPKTPKNQYDFGYVVGGCAFYIMDLRGHRNYNRRTANKVLGKPQLERIETWLASPEVVSAKAIFITVPVPIVHHRNFIVNHADIGFFGIADDVRDQWEHKSNWAERDKLLTAVFKHSAKYKKAVLFLSGDVHVGAAFSLNNDKYPEAKVFQLTSSAVTYANYHGSILRLIIKQSGELGHNKSSRYGVTRFNNLCVFEENNFAVVRTTGLSSEEPAITFDLYGASEDNEQMIRKGPHFLI